MIYFENEQDLMNIDNEFESSILKTIDFALKEEIGDIPYEISLLFVDNEAIREINREQRGIDKATDVLSFPQLFYPKDKVFKEVYLDHEFSPEDLDGENLVLGDIVLSLERAEEQRFEYGHSFERECSYLVVHSVLHLLGYDHMNEIEKSKMRFQEEEILKKLDMAR
ncbi:rRNA maturation RNase YbeY [Clostridium hydrogeniformans]|uniref:rRNA maturation RNase YbeY n=1 Tax=Clostridium hydrogeniformans TaxID=349933 RepID=UPI0004890DEC|nr:rRNA maturation RNase YbeY [Clostridium hydrogeniformans]